MLEVTGDAEAATYLFELGPQDCGSVAVVQQLVVGPCAEGTMTITGAAGSDVWFWVGPTIYGEGVAQEYRYLLNTSTGTPSAVENHSLTSVKSLFK